MMDKNKEEILMESKYIDEQIISLKMRINHLRTSPHLVEKQKDQFDFEKGLIVYQTKEIPVKKRKVLESFEVMDDALVRVKYPAFQSADRIVFTNEDTTVNIIFNIQGISENTDDLLEISKEFKKIISKVYPMIDLKAHINTKGNTDFSYITCITPSLDHPIYNLTFFFFIEDCFITGACNCFETDREDWEVIFLKLLETITAL